MVWKNNYRYRTHSICYLKYCSVTWIAPVSWPWYHAHLQYICTPSASTEGPGIGHPVVQHSEKRVPPSVCVPWGGQIKMGINLVKLTRDRIKQFFESIPTISSLLCKLFNLIKHSLQLCNTTVKCTFFELNWNNFISLWEKGLHRRTSLYVGAPPSYNNINTMYTTK